MVKEQTSAYNLMMNKSSLDLQERIIFDWIKDLDDVNAIKYSITDKGLYFTYYKYDDDNKLIQADYCPHYFTHSECYDHSIELQALFEYCATLLEMAEETSGTIEPM